MLREDRSDKLTNSARGRLFISASGGCVVAMEHSNRLNGRAGAILERGGLFLWDLRWWYQLLQTISVWKFM